MADDQNKTPATTVDLFTVTEVPVTLTYDGLGAPPITFYLRPCLNSEEQLLRQAQLALPDKDRQAGIHTHNMEMATRLEMRVPDGIVNYAGNIRSQFALEDENVEDGAEQTRRQQRNLIKRKVLADLMSRYYLLTQPSEFFRSL